MSKETQAATVYFFCFLFINIGLVLTLIPVFFGRDQIAAAIAFYAVTVLPGLLWWLPLARWLDRRMDGRP